jgi:hypothetical protein
MQPFSFSTVAPNKTLLCTNGVIVVFYTTVVPNKTLLCANSVVVVFFTVLWSVRAFALYK